MLTQVLLDHRDRSWATACFAAVVAAPPDELWLDDQERLCFNTTDAGGATRVAHWSPALLWKRLAQAPPEIAVPTLYWLCRLYDYRQETSDMLRDAAASVLQVTVGPALFYWSARYSGVLTTASVVGAPQKTDAAQVKPSGDAGVYHIVLPASAWLCGVLAEFLKERAL